MKTNFLTFIVLLMTTVGLAQKTPKVITGKIVNESKQGKTFSEPK